MKHRFLGRSGLKVSAISYGNWLTHGSQVTGDQAIDTIHAALDAGITTFDTADVYANGAAEEILGKALKGQRRESLEVFTKVYWPVGPVGADGTIGGVNDTGLSRKHIMESINASLMRLETDYVDLYQAHRYDHETPLEETMIAFADVVRAGKALYIGVSEWTADQIRQASVLAKDLHVQLVSNQPQYNMLWRIIEPEVVPTCRELGLSQICWSPMAQGLLTGKYVPGAKPPAGSRATDPTGSHFISKLVEDEGLLSSVQKLRPIAADLGCTMGQLALAWVIANDNVASAIAGASRPEQIRESAEAVNVELTPEVLALIDEALAGHIEADGSKVAESSPQSRLR